MNRKIIGRLLGLSLAIFVFLTPNYVYAGGTCDCIGMSCGNNNINNCTGGDTPTCSGNLGLCGCTCVPQFGVSGFPSPGLSGSPASAPALCPGGTSIDTAIGCIPFTKDQDMAAFFLKWGMGIGGGIATILIVVASFMISTSQGDPHRLQAGKELLTSAISGLVLLVFSAFVLNFIGVDILGIF